MGVAFYGDIACPFCFAENERLLRLGLAESLPFKALTYLPELPVPWDPSEQKWQDLMADGLTRLEKAAPELEFVRPAGIPNSLRATRALVEATQRDPKAASRLRTWLFRALWQEGRDIGLDEVVEEGLASSGLPTDLGTSRDARREAKLWHTEWKNGGFDDRIPVLATASGQRLLGLASDQAITAFVTNPRHGGHGPDVCKS